MGFFDIFKKSKEIEIKKIKLGDIKQILESEKEKNKEQTSLFLESINNHISKLMIDIVEGIGVLEKIDLKETKAEEKLKLITLENLNNYIIHLKKLIKNLDILKEKNKPNELIKEIDSIFQDFDSKSIMSFEKATILIGKELGNVKNSIVNFFENFRKTVKENQDSLDNLGVISIIEEKLEEVNIFDDNKNSSKKGIGEIDKRIKELSKVDNGTKEEIEKIKNTEEYKEELIKQDENKKQKQEIVDEIYNLKQMIDFKLLSNIYHSNEKEMKIIQQYKDNFKENFEKTNGEDLLDLFSENDENKNKISEKIYKIIQKQEIVSINKTPSTQQDNIKELESKSEKIKSNIEDLEEEENKEKKRHDKFEENLQELINEIKSELIKIGLKLEK